MKHYPVTKTLTLTEKRLLILTFEIHQNKLLLLFISLILLFILIATFFVFKAFFKGVNHIFNFCILNIKHFHHIFFRHRIIKIIRKNQPDTIFSTLLKTLF